MKSARALAIIFLVVVVISALVPQVWTSADYGEQVRRHTDAPPSRRSPLGTDALGRDRLSLLLAPAAALLSCIAAALIGGIAGLAGGWTEGTILAIVDLFLSLPWLLL